MTMDESRDGEPRERPDGAAFRDFCELCETLAATSGRKARTAAVAAYLASLSPEETEAAARLLVGRVFADREGRKLAVGGRTLLEVVRVLGVDGGDAEAGADFGEALAKRMPQSASGEPLLLLEVIAELRAIAAIEGGGSRRRRLDALVRLFGRASRLEATYLARIAVADMRNGVREGTLVEGIAAMSGVATADVRRAQQTHGDVGVVAREARRDPAALIEAGVQLFRPLAPMLAQSATGAGEAFDELGGDLALEWKLDGARVQIHCRGSEVRIFTRRLNEVTHSLPEIVALLRERRNADEAIFEGEVLAVRDGRPLPFQELMRRFRRKREVERMAEAIPVELYLFDLLHRDGTSLLDAGAGERWRQLTAACGTLQRVAHIEPATREDAVEFYGAAVAAGHEGVVAKSLAGPYVPGARGRHWLKVKRVHTVDLAVIAAEWGYGRRKGWLSNYHLAARDSEGRLRMVGKTFKGPTDAVFRAMTEKLLDLELSRDRVTVYVRPQIVAEVKFEGVQPSDLYDSGIALRFARIVRFRDDKPVDEVDSLDSLRLV